MQGNSNGPDTHTHTHTCSLCVTHTHTLVPYLSHSHRQSRCLQKAFGVILKIYGIRRKFEMYIRSMPLLPYNCRPKVDSLIWIQLPFMIFDEYPALHSSTSKPAGLSLFWGIYLKGRSSSLNISGDWLEVNRALNLAKLWQGQYGDGGVRGGGDDNGLAPASPRPLFSA